MLDFFENMWDDLSRKRRERIERKKVDSILDSQYKEKIAKTDTLRKRQEQAEELLQEVAKELSNAKSQTDYEVCDKTLEAIGELLK